MARPPTSRPPPSPPQLSRPPSDTASRRQSGLSRSSIRDGHHPKSPSRRYNAFQPVTRAGSRGMSSISRSFSSGGSQQQPQPMDEPDNTAIIRGAQILRERFLSKMKKDYNEPQPVDERGTITASPERLFNTKDDDVLQDLLGIKPMHPPGSPNDVTFQFFAPESPDWMPDWSESWSISGSAFQQGSVMSPNTRNQHNADTPVRGTSSRNHQQHNADTPIRGTTGNRTGPDAHRHQRRHDHRHRNNHNNTEEGNNNEARRHGLHPLVPRTSGKPPRAVTPERPKSQPEQPVTPEVNATTNVTPPPTTTNSNSNSPTNNIVNNNEWQRASSFRTDMDDSNPWANLSELEIDASTMEMTGPRSRSTGPRSKSTGPDPPADQQKKTPSPTQEQPTVPIQSDVQPLVVNGDVIMPVVTSSQPHMTPTPPPPQQTPPDHAQAFVDELIETTSLDDKAFEELIDAQEHVGSRQRVEGWLLAQNNNNNNSNVNQRLVAEKILADEQLQAKVKQQAAAVAGIVPLGTTAAVAAITGATRGKPQRSFSQGILRKKNSPKRTFSVGGSRKGTYKRNPHSSLRDDLLCGIESNCNSKYATEPIPVPMSPGEMLQSSCAQACADERVHLANPAAAPLGKQARSFRIRHGRPVLPKADADVLDHVERERQRAEGMAAAPVEIPTFASPVHVPLYKENRFGILSPESDDYMHMQKADPAFQHAMKAGGLWQALVGNHVRFPKYWYQGKYRTTPLGCPPHLVGKNKWVYYDRHRIKGNKYLNRFVRKRDAPGQLLLHLVVRDFMTSSPILDIAIGCFHPNAKSIRLSQTPNPRNDDCRDVWMATRFRTEDMISVIDPLFFLEKMGQPKKTPLGDSKRRISNSNVRAIFGESPPICTVFVQESEIYEALASMDGFERVGPADILLRKYVFQMD